MCICCVIRMSPEQRAAILKKMGVKGPDVHKTAQTRVKRKAV